MSKAAKKKQKENILIESIGWYGAIAIILAYTLLSTRMLSVNSIAYQLMNLTGAVSILFEAAHKKVWQSVTLNSIWAIVAFIALIRIL